jgi:PPOX class probable F420-dependent enzyme
MSRSGTHTIDETTDAGARAANRLRTSRVIWMTTVSARGVPQSSPVWYLWDGGDFTVYSLESPRHANVTTNPSVGLNLDGNGQGGDIVVVEALARIDHSLPVAAENEAYLAKYGAIMAERDWSPKWFGDRYSVPLAITPTKYRYW